MSTPNSAITTQAIGGIGQSFVNADGAVGTTLAIDLTNLKLLYTAGASGSIIKSLMANLDDGTARVLVLAYDDLTHKYVIGTVNIPVNSGATGAIANIDLLASAVLLGFPLDASGRAVIQLPPNKKLWAGVQVAVTAAKTLNVTGSAEDF